MMRRDTSSYWGETVTVTTGAEKAHVYGEGGIAFSRNLPGIGWTLNGDPSRTIQELAILTRRAAFPALPPITLAELLAA